MTITIVHPQAYFGFGGGGGGYGEPFPGHPFVGFGQFRERYRCFSMVFSNKTSEEITHGGKIIMPPSALEKLSRLNISYPMLFKLSNGAHDRQTHCGVLEFVAEEGRIYVPHWVRKTSFWWGSGLISLSLSLSLSFTHMYIVHSLILLLIHKHKLNISHTNMFFTADDKSALHPRWGHCRSEKCHPPTGNILQISTTDT